MPHVLTITDRQGLVRMTRVIDRLDQLAAELPGGLTLTIDAEIDGDPRHLPHAYRAPRRVPERGHFALPCLTCGTAFDAPIHRVTQFGIDGSALA